MFSAGGLISSDLPSWESFTSTCCIGKNDFARWQQQKWEEWGGSMGLWQMLCSFPFITMRFDIVQIGSGHISKGIVFCWLRNHSHLIDKLSSFWWSLSTWVNIFYSGSFEGHWFPCHVLVCEFDAISSCGCRAIWLKKRVLPREMFHELHSVFYVTNAHWFQKLIILTTFQFVIRQVIMPVRMLLITKLKVEP